MLNFEETYQSYGYGWANVSNTPYRLFKQFDHEGGIHTPMIVHWPNGIAERGSIVKQVSHLIDIIPTVLDVTKTEPLELIDGQPPIQMDGMSLLRTLRGLPQGGHEELFFHHAKGKAIWHGRWKMVRVAKSEWELYDIQNDPNELNNLAQSNPDKVRQLSNRWAAWSERQTKRARNEVK